MATKLNDKYLSDFIGDHEYDGVAAEVKAAHKVLHDGSGLGNESPLRKSCEFCGRYPAKPVFSIPGRGSSSFRKIRH